MDINTIEAINAFLEIILFAFTTSKAFKAFRAFFNKLSVRVSAPP